MAVQRSNERQSPSLREERNIYRNGRMIYDQVLRERLCRSRRTESFWVAVDYKYFVPTGREPKTFVLRTLCGQDVRAPGAFQSLLHSRQKILNRFIDPSLQS